MKAALIEYEGNRQSSLEQVGAVLQTNHFALIRNFPLSKDTLAAFCRNFGPLLPAYGTRIEGEEDIVGDVWVNADLNEQERLLTEGNSELGPHTAHAWRIHRPRYFGLLMINPGWRDQEAGNNGESIFTHIDDILSEMKRVYPESFNLDFKLLHETPVELQIRHAEDEIDHSPLLFDIEDGGIGLRYKGNTLELIAEAIPTIPNGRAYHEALSRLYVTAQHTEARLEVSLEAGDFAFFDNRRIMHARNTFPFSRTGGNEVTEVNPRRLYNIHVL